MILPTEPSTNTSKVPNAQKLLSNQISSHLQFEKKKILKNSTLFCGIFHTLTLYVRRRNISPGRHSNAPMDKRCRLSGSYVTFAHVGDLIRDEESSPTAAQHLYR